MYVYLLYVYIFTCSCSVAKLCLNLCDPMDHSTLGLLVSHYLPEFTQVHVYWIGDAIQQKTFENPLDSKEIRPVNLKRNQSWKFTGRTDAEAETPVFLVGWYEQLTLWKCSWCWERLKAEGEEGSRGQDDYMASLKQ